MHTTPAGLGGEAEPVIEFDVVPRRAQRVGAGSA